MKNELRKWIILACNIYMVEEEVFGGGPKGGIEEEICEREREWERESEWVSEAYPISWVSGRPRYDKTNFTSLELRRECFYVLWNGGEGGLI